MKKYDIDALSVTSDEEIFNILRSLRREISEIEGLMRNGPKRRFKQSLENAQIEYCYVKREHEIRVIRHSKHRDFLQKKPFFNRNRV